ncbi:Major facilitator transporter, partial [Pseudomonas coronafaciens pv. garcae]
SEEVATGEVSSMLGAFQMTFLSVGVLAMFAAGIFLQLPVKAAEIRSGKAATLNDEVKEN